MHFMIGLIPMMLAIGWISMVMLLILEAESLCLQPNQAPAAQPVSVVRVILIK